MRFDEQDPYVCYDNDTSKSVYSDDSESPCYHTERRCTPMGAPRRSKRRSGWIMTLVIVLLLAGAALSTHQLSKRFDLRLNHLNGGFSISVQPKDVQQNPISATDSQSPELANPPSSGTNSTMPKDESEPPVPSEQPSLSESETPVQPETPESASAFLNVQDSPSSAATQISNSPEALSLQEIYEKLSPSVVSIVSSLQSGNATGTGIIMSETGYIITNHHVIEDALQITVLTHDDRQYSAMLIGSDAISDLAVLQIEATDLIAATFGDSDALRVGDSVVAIGDPLGIQLRGTMTNGIVSAINRDLTVEDRKMTLIQTNAALNSGNSGGPLINCYGQVIGINTMKMSSYYSNASVEGLGFAIPVSVAKPIIDELIENGYVAGRPAIGINGESMPEYARLYYRLPKGVYITYVSESSDAYLKGIRENDILTAVNGASVTSLDEVNSIKNQYSAGDILTLTIYRGGLYYDVEVTLMDQALQ